MVTFLFFLCLIIVDISGLVKVKESLNWYDADNYCLKVFGTHLISIHSHEQHNRTANFCV